MSEKNIENKTKSVITKKDINKAWFRWFMFSEVSLNFERLQALAFCNSISGVLEKLYLNKSDLAKALKRHLGMYNTQANWGTIVNGISIALEEEAANDPENNETTDKLIMGLKTGLMGPISGIGDTLDFGTIRPIVIGICVPFVMKGSVIAALIPLIFQVIYMIITSKLMVKLGYEKGKESIVNILKNGKIHRVIEGAGMFGLLMMGALSATYVKISTPLIIATEGGNKIVLQEMLDKIIPCMLPIIAVFLIYFYICKRGPYYIRILLTIIMISLGLSFFGIL